VDISAVRNFLGRFQDIAVRQEFGKHLRRYLEIYHLDCGFCIEVTDRYLSRSHQEEACVIARKHYDKDEEIKYLVGYLAELDENDEEELNSGENIDFSIIKSSRRQVNCLMLGPARFVNHDCEPNAKFVSINGITMKIVTIRPINVGEEITVEYSKNYFGRKNRECLCATCESLGHNGYSKEPDSEDEENDDDDEALNNKITIGSPVKKEPKTEINGFADDKGTTSESEESLHSSRCASIDTASTSVDPDPSLLADIECKLKPESNGTLRRALRRRQETNYYSGFFDGTNRSSKKKAEEDAMSEYAKYNRTYNSEAYKDEYKLFDPNKSVDSDSDEEYNVVTKECENCKVLYLVDLFPQGEAELSKHNVNRRLCHRCHRHALIYNACWPSNVQESLVPMKLYTKIWSQGHYQHETNVNNNSINTPSTPATPTVLNSTGDIPKRGRGRPRKTPLPQPATETKKRKRSEPPPPTPPKKRIYRKASEPSPDPDKPMQPRRVSDWLLKRRSMEKNNDKLVNLVQSRILSISNNSLFNLDDIWDLNTLKKKSALGPKSQSPRPPPPPVMVMVGGVLVKRGRGRPPKKRRLNLVQASSSVIKPEPQPDELSEPQPVQREPELSEPQPVD
jgi:hypothetical protein